MDGSRSRCPPGSRWPSCSSPRSHRALLALRAVSELDRLNAPLRRSPDAAAAARPDRASRSGPRRYGDRGPRTGGVRRLSLRGRSIHRDGLRRDRDVSLRAGNAVGALSRGRSSAAPPRARETSPGPGERRPRGGGRPAGSLGGMSLRRRGPAPLAGRRDGTARRSCPTSPAARGTAARSSSRSTPGPPTAARGRSWTRFAKSGIRTTIFLTGEFIRRYPEIVRRIAADGHEVGNHTDTHPHLTTYAENGRQATRAGVDRAFLVNELARTARAWEEATGRTMAPYLARALRRAERGDPALGRGGRLLARRVDRRPRRPRRPRLGLRPPLPRLPHLGPRRRGPGRAGGERRHRPPPPRERPGGPGRVPDPRFSTAWRPAVSGSSAPPSSSPARG